jgi:ABC-2 type transport system permease protein
MTTLTLDRSTTATPTLPAPRVVTTELRKMFDTRSGFWLLWSIGILATLATAAVIVFAPDEELKYSSFATAIGFPMAVILPIIAILSVTSEWSQRNALTTFTLVPGRSRVIAAKFLCAVAVGAVSMLVAFAIGALGTVVGSAIAGVDQVWDTGIGDLALIVLANVLGLMVGFMLGVLIRNSAGAIVAYFVFSLLLPTLSSLLASTQEWFRDIVGWVDFNYAQSALFNGSLTGEQWGQLGVTTLGWVILPMALGIWLVTRSEVK